jgi:hypothetical protein
MPAQEFEEMHALDETGHKYSAEAVDVGLISEQPKPESPCRLAAVYVGDIVEAVFTLAPFLPVVMFSDDHAILLLAIAVAVVQCLTIVFQMLPMHEYNEKLSDEFLLDMRKIVLCGKLISNAIVVSVLTRGSLYFVLPMFALHAAVLMCMWSAMRVEVHERLVLFTRAVTSLCILLDDSPDRFVLMGLSLSATTVEFLLSLVDGRCFHLFSECVKQVCFFLYIFSAAASISPPNDAE